MGLAAAVALLMMGSAAPAGATTAGWIQGARSAAARTAPAGAQLADGRLLVAGGFPGFSNSIATAEIYDPATDTWSGAASMPGGRSGAAAATLADGRVLVAGGDDFSGYYADAWIYDPVANSWSTVASLPAARAGAGAGLLPDGRVMVVGGQDSGGANLASTEIYDPGANTWTAGPAMSSTRFAPAVIRLADGRILAAGGVNNSGATISSAEVYDPATSTWSPIASMPEALDGAAGAALTDGRVLIAGGATGTGDQAIPAIYTPASDTWVTAPSPSNGHFEGVAGALSGGRMVIAEGETFSGRAEIFTPADPASRGLGFGDQVVARRSVDGTLWIDNHGVDYLRVTSVSVAGPQAADFQVVGDECSNATVGRDDRCPIYLAYTPHAAGASSGTLHIAFSGGTGQADFPLTGNGVAEPAPTTTVVTQPPVQATSNASAEPRSARLRHTLVRLSRAGRVVVELDCPTGTPISTGSVKLRVLAGRHVTLGQGAFQCPAGSHRFVRFTVLGSVARGLRARRHHRLRSVAYITTRNAAGRTAVLHQKVVVLVERRG